MTTETPTNNGFGEPAAGIAAGPLDESILTGLANEFFRALPGQTLASPGRLPSEPDPFSPPLLQTPRFVPAVPGGNGVPEAVLQGAPGAGSFPGTLSQGVPEAVGAGVPPLESQTAAAPTSPYYFLGEAGAPSTKPSGVSTHTGHTAPLSHGLPGENNVLALVREIVQEDARVPGGGVPITPDAADPRGATNAAPTSTAHASVPSGGSPSGHGAAPAPIPAAPVGDDLPGALAYGVPEVVGAGVPVVESVSAPTPSLSPYYFLGEAGSQAAPVQAQGVDRATPQSHRMPGDLDVLALVRDALGESPRGGKSAEAPGSNSGFYFIDPIATDGGAIPVIGNDPHPPFDVLAIRRDFPILATRVNGRPLVWFDNAATTQKPQAVLDRLAYFYSNENSNIHRAAHELAARATDAYEGARQKVARFLGAASADEIVFVRGATEAINLVAQTWGAQHLGEGDEIVVSHLEHHANIVPWQQIAAEKGAKIRVIPVDDSGQILLEEYRKLLNGRTKIVAVAHVSNALGTITPVKEIVDMAHGVGALALVDGAQSVSHLRVNMQALGADFFVFSGHKIFGPTGIGVVYGKKALLDSLPPWQGGGNMIEDVTFEKTVYQPSAPARFEAGTGNIADAVGLGAALDYLERVGIENVARYEHDLLAYATQYLKTIPGLRLIGTAREKTSVLSFVLEGYTTVEVGKALNEEGIAVRAGHHCAQPILRRFGAEATVRPSIAFYNTCEEVDRMVGVLRKLRMARK